MLFYFTWILGNFTQLMQIWSSLPVSSILKSAASLALCLPMSNIKFGKQFLNSDFKKIYVSSKADGRYVIYMYLLSTIQQFIRAFILLCLQFIPYFFMNLPVKINMKRYDRHNKTLWIITHSFNCVLYLVHPKIKFHILCWTKAVTDPNLTHI